MSALSVVVVFVIVNFWRFAGLGEEDEEKVEEDVDDVDDVDDVVDTTGKDSTATNSLVAVERFLFAPLVVVTGNKSVERMRSLQGVPLLAGSINSSCKYVSIRFAWLRDTIRTSW